MAETSGGQQQLEELERANLFVVPLDDEQSWFRYHHLFADLLRHRLQQQNVDVAQLHTRASHWYADNGFPAEAIHHAIEAPHPVDDDPKTGDDD